MASNNSPPKRSAPAEEQVLKKKAKHGRITPRPIPKDEWQAYKEVRKEFKKIQRELDDKLMKGSDEVLGSEFFFWQKKMSAFQQRQTYIAKIPNFWTTVLYNHSLLNQLIHEREEECLKFLKEINVEHVETGYKIHFFFEENEFFTNSVITKEFVVKGPEAVKSTTTEINWSKQDTLIDEIKLTLEAEATEEEFFSFFYWLTDNDAAANDDVAEAIKHEIWQDPLRYYILAEPKPEKGEKQEEEVEPEQD